MLRINLLNNFRNRGGYGSGSGLAEFNGTELIFIYFETTLLC